MHRCYIKYLLAIHWVHYHIYYVRLLGRATEVAKGEQGDCTEEVF